MAVFINTGILGHPVAPSVTVPDDIPAAGFNAATEKPLYFHSSDTALPGHPVDGATGDEARGMMRVIPGERHPSQVFISDSGRMFSRVREDSGWSPWWQMAGKPVSEGTGTFLFSAVKIAVRYGQEVAGSSLSPVRPGAWLALGITSANTAMLFQRIR